MAGRLAYQLFFRPRGALRRCIVEGGPIEQLRTAKGRLAMENAAGTLPLLHRFTGQPVRIHLLTGHRFWYQTLFCLWTFARHAERTLHPVIYDDGSLAEAHRESLRRIFPAARFVSHGEANAALETHLPSGRYPHLHERWHNYPNIRKLIDPHVGSTGWKLVLDSDLLFFRRPEFLLSWSDAPSKPLHAIDCETSYGYSRALMDRLAGAPTGELVNVGLTGLNSDEIDWDKLESWTAALHSAEGSSYFLEQALIAMLVAGRPCAIASESDYVTFPSVPETNDPTAVMHHYVAGSKRDYFRHCWRRAIA